MWSVETYVWNVKQPYLPPNCVANPSSTGPSKYILMLVTTFGKMFQLIRLLLGITRLYSSVDTHIARHHNIIPTISSLNFGRFKTTLIQVF